VVPRFNCPSERDEGPAGANRKMDGGKVEGNSEELTAKRLPCLLILRQISNNFDFDFMPCA